MNETNPQIEEQLNKLAEIVCQSLDGNQDVISGESEALLKALLMCGYARKEGSSFQTDVETHVRDKCLEPAMNRGGAISGITRQLQEKFDKLVRWESRQPDAKSEPKAANFSSSTDA